MQGTRHTGTSTARNQPPPSAANWIPSDSAQHVHPITQLIPKIYVKGVKLSNKARQHYERALSRLPELRKWFITIEPEIARHICELAI